MYCIYVQGFLLMDTDCDGIVCYEVYLLVFVWLSVALNVSINFFVLWVQDMSDILQCLNVEPKATITVQDWYAMIDSYRFTPTLARVHKHIHTNCLWLSKIYLSVLAIVFFFKCNT